MDETLKPCPLCGGTDLKHYVTNARERNRGVVVCKGCGLRLEAYSDDEYKVAQAYQGDFKAAHEFTWEQARKAVADKWNLRAERTCSVECYPPGYEDNLHYEVCSECGTILTASRPGDRHAARASYCPECGRKVLYDSDDYI